jgi:hypothetical protein
VRELPPGRQLAWPCFEVRVTTRRCFGSPCRDFDWLLETFKFVEKPAKTLRYAAMPNSRPTPCEPAAVPLLRGLT